MWKRRRASLCAAAIAGLGYRQRAAQPHRNAKYGGHGGAGPAICFFEMPPMKMLRRGYELLVYVWTKYWRARRIMPDLLQQQGGQHHHAAWPALDAAEQNGFCGTRPSSLSTTAFNAGEANMCADNASRSQVGYYRASDARGYTRDQHQQPASSGCHHNEAAALSCGAAPAEGFTIGLAGLSRLTSLKAGNKRCLSIVTQLTAAGGLCQQQPAHVGNVVGAA